MVPAEGIEAKAGAKPCCAKMRDDLINIGDNAAFVNSDDFANSAGIRTKTRECCHKTATPYLAPRMACPGLSTNSDGQTPADRSPHSLRIDRPAPTEPTGLDGELIVTRLHPQFPWGLPPIGPTILATIRNTLMLKLLRGELSVAKAELLGGNVLVFSCAPKPFY